jgi:hypothetical protein
MADSLRTFVLLGDDFAYLAESRTWPRLIGSLGKPHNAHIVPLFRTWTYTLITIAGRLENLPPVVGAASYGVLVLVMLTGSHVVAHEAHDQTPGLAAMALLGVTTVMEPATVWYSAGQPLWAGFCILAMLAALQKWRSSAGPAWLILAVAATLAAPAFWSGGYAAGPVGAVYLWLDGRPRSRRAAALPIAATAAFVLAVLLAKGPALFSSRSVPTLSLTSPAQGVLHSCQAIVEALVLGNLGHDAETTASQGALLTILLLGAWSWSRRPVGRLNALEVAGATLVASSLLMVYTFRGNYPYSSLRSLGWYHAMPQVGFVLFLGGWWIRRFPAEGEVKGLRPVTRGGACAVVALTAALLILHVPRAERLLAASVGVSTEFVDREATPVRLQALPLARRRAEAQRRFLARLDEAERVAKRLAIGREAIRIAFGRIVGPGLPREAEDLDAADLLNLPGKGSVTDPEEVRAAIGALLAPPPSVEGSSKPAEKRRLD